MQDPAMAHPRVTRAVALATGLVLVLALLSAAVPGRPAAAAASCPSGTGYGGQRTSSTDRSVSNGGNGCMIIVYSGGSDVLVHTGAVQKWTVPAGVTSVTLHLIGAGGGAGLSGRGGSQGGNGGGGGYATGTLEVTPGTVYDVIVGGGGRYMCTSDAPQNLTLTQRRNFSFGGGAAGYGGATWDCSWASGGGRTALRTDGGADDIITAGGGGGGGYWSGHGGAGGGTTGQDGASDSRGTGGTQSAGGSGGVVEDGHPGIQYAGGPAGLDTSLASEGGGGGGGYYGGGGAGNNSGGGGGSSYVGTARGLQSGSTQAGSWRTPGAVAPTNSGVPTIAGTARVGSTLTATTGTWSGATSKQFKWQVSANNSTWTDIDGATGATYVVGVVGYVRVVETAENIFGTTTANSAATTLITDTTLSALTVSVGSLTPSFSSGVFSYAVSVPYATTSIKVTATRTHASTTLTVNGSAVSSGVISGSIPLSVGSNVIPVVATNTGVSTTTNITVTRAAATVATAPTITSVTPGDRTLAVAFTTPVDDGGEPIDDYEYSLNSGAWVSMSGTASPFRIASLTNGTAYSVRVRAVTSVGKGDPSAPVSGTPVSPATTTTATSTTSTVPVTTTSDSAVAATTPTASVVGTTPASGSRAPVVTQPPVTTSVATATTTTSTVPPGPGESVPQLDPGEAFVSRDGASGSFEISRQDNTLIVTSADVTAVLAVKDASGAVLPLDGDGSIRIKDATSLVSVQVSGFAPSSDVETWIYSKGTLVGTASVNAAGRASANYPVPAGLPGGRHRIVMAGTAADGTDLTIAVGIVAGPVKSGSSAGRTLFLTVLVIAAFAALFLPAVARRRRREAGAPD